MIELELSSHKDNLDKCPICKCNSTHHGSSMHGWDIVYECGCRVCGAISDDIVSMSTNCPEYKEVENECK